MRQEVVVILTVYIIGLSLLGFGMMGVDKRRARRKEWRIPEKTLLIIAFIGGGIGSLVGMYVFRHKTKHIKFIVLLPISAVLVIMFLLFIYQKL